MANPGNLYIKFWGVRGTAPALGTDFTKYGGNTSCIEVRANNRQIILDAGTGLRELGNHTKIFHTDILLSHTHLDHIQGLPFFKPLYKKDSNVALWGGHLLPKNNLENILGMVMRPPVFPLTLSDVSAKVEFNDFIAGTELKNVGLNSAGISIKTHALNHPDGATGYRIEYNGKSVCYITDIEHHVDNINQELVKFVKNSDVLIYDSTFDDKEFLQYKGWGHSTWQEAIRVGTKANVKKIVAFHHNPELNDAALSKRAKQIVKTSKIASLAVEGEEIFL